MVAWKLLTRASLGALLLAGLSAVALAGSDEEPAQPPAKPDVVAPPDPCIGKNPITCGRVTTEDGETLYPPGACKGRNPAWCKEVAPKPEVVKRPERLDRANPDANPNRNPNRNPNQNPNRRPRRSSGGD